MLRAMCRRHFGDLFDPTDSNHHFKLLQPCAGFECIVVLILTGLEEAMGKHRAQVFHFSNNEIFAHTNTGWTKHGCVSKCVCSCTNIYR